MTIDGGFAYPMYWPRRLGLDVCRYGVPIFGLVALTGVITLSASGRMHSPLARPLVTVHDIRLAPAPPLNARPSSTLTFAVQNASADTFTYLALRVLIFNSRSGDGAEQRPIAGPYMITGAVELRPRHTLRYEIRLRNLGADCACTVRIRVVAARAMDDKLRRRAGVSASASRLAKYVVTKQFIRGERKVWLVCDRCHLRWSGERRSAGAADYRGFERRRR